MQYNNVSHNNKYTHFEVCSVTFRQFSFSFQHLCVTAGDSEDNSVPLHQLARSRRPVIIRLHTRYDRTNERIPRERRRPYMHSLQVGTYTVQQAYCKNIKAVWVIDSFFKAKFWLVKETSFALIQTLSSCGQELLLLSTNLHNCFELFV